MNITYFECVFVALFIKHAKCLLHVILSSAARLSVSYFSALSPKGHNFRENVCQHKCVFLFSLQLLSEMFLIRRRIKRDFVITDLRSFCKVRLSCFN